MASCPFGEFGIRARLPPFFLPSDRSRVRLFAAIIARRNFLTGAVPPSLFLPPEYFLQLAARDLADLFMEHSKGRRIFPPFGKFPSLLRRVMPPLSFLLLTEFILFLNLIFS